MSPHNPAWTEDHLRDVASDYALGLADPVELLAFEMLLEAKDDAALAELTASTETAARIAHGVDFAKPSEALRNRLLKGIHGPESKPRLLPGFREETAGYHVLRPAAGVWRRTPYVGVDVIPLSKDPASGMLTSLLRMAPGASYPSHRHVKEEQCWVLEGEYDQPADGLVLRAGDYVRAMSGTTQGAIHTANGCLLLMVSCIEDEILE